MVFHEKNAQEKATKGKRVTLTLIGEKREDSQDAKIVIA